MVAARIRYLFPMSDFLRHECGLAVVRLRRPLSYYLQRHGDAAWGLRQLYLLMEKQHNRGQDGAGLAVVKFAMPGGEPYLRRVRSDKHNALERIFDIVMRDVRTAKVQSPHGQSPNDESKATTMDFDPLDFGLSAKRRHRFVGELYLGHLRYGTHSGYAKTNCHPFVRNNNTASRNLAIAGNFNMTNSTELFKQLIEYGLNPVGESDTQVILERIGYFLDREHDFLHSTMGPESFLHLEGRELAREISEQLNIVRIMNKASEGWDGGYVFAGLLGNGDCFVCRDPAGIRPGFFHIDDEVVAAASERAALASVFNVDPSLIKPIEPGHVLVVKRSGTIVHERFTDPLPLRQCTFERVYFSRGNDPDIYQERKALGRHLAPRVLQAIDQDIERAVFSFIPNTAEPAYMGMLERIDELTRARHAEELWQRVQAGTARREDLDNLLNGRLRAEKIAHKDQRMRTFITHDAARHDLVVHIYDITRGVVKPDDTLVVLDDSIVRGTTLRESIITILSRLNPRRIIIASSAPPIMYPDCYGIDMSQLGRFIAFEAAVTLLRERGEEHVLADVERLCLEQADWPPHRMANHVARIYERFTLDEISKMVARLVRPRNIPWPGQIDIIYQTVEDLRASMPGHSGDWYFTGSFPTAGGYRVLNTSFLNWRRNEDGRAYEAKPASQAQEPELQRPRPSRVDFTRSRAAKP
jgi:amidophosphoribosyltransferase